MHLLVVLRHLPHSGWLVGVFLHLDFT